MAYKHFATTGKKAPIDKLPIVCIAFAKSFSCLDLPDDYHASYVDIMCRFAALNVPLKKEALTALGKSYQCNAYPEQGNFAIAAKTDIQHKAVTVTQELGKTYGTKLPAAFYQVLLKIAFEEGAKLTLFTGKKPTTQDRTYSSVLRAFTMVTPLHLHIQSVLSQNGLRLEQVNHTYALKPTLDNAFYICSPEGSDMKALMESLIANMLEQYSASTIV